MRRTKSRALETKHSISTLMVQLVRAAAVGNVHVAAAAEPEFLIWLPFEVEQIAHKLDC